LTGDGRNAALLTKSFSVKTGIPSWSPDGQALAVATLRGSTSGIDILTGLQPYKDRLMNPVKIDVFQAIEQK
jgi:Tol biopolymer transport system component